MESISSSPMINEAIDLIDEPDSIVLLLQWWRGASLDEIGQGEHITMSSC
jgi:hypothetical protein